MLKQTLTALITLLASSVALPAASYYTVRLDDPKAVFLTHGSGDDSDAIQQAIDKVQETTGEGVVFVPEGRYRLTKTVYVSPAIRLIGYGTERPVFVLGENTPGYQDPSNENYMVFFTGGRGRQGGRGGATGGRPGDAGAGTFYSGMSNIDIEILGGNPGAVGVRGRYAQHCFLAHMDFRIGSGLAGIHETGNVMEDVQFSWRPVRHLDAHALARMAVHRGGRHLRGPAGGRHPGARRRPDADPPAVPQRSHRHLHRPRVSRRALGEGRPLGGHLRPRRDRQPRGERAAPKSTWRTWPAGACPVFASFRESGKKVAAPGEMYEVKTFSHGLHLSRHRRRARRPRTCSKPRLIATMPALGEIRPARSAGARHLGEHTHRWAPKAMASPTIPRPSARPSRPTARSTSLSGKYVVSDTIVLKPDTVLIGLHPSATQIDPARRHGRIPGSGRSQADDRGAQGRHQHHDRHRPLHQRHQSAGGGREMDGRRRTR